MNTDHPKTVVVTGAASGIGFACMQALLAAGHQVCAADLDPVPMETLTPEQSARLLALRADVADAESCRNVAARTMEKFGALTGLIHMAAAHSTQTWRELSGDHFNRIMAVNVTGAFLMAQAVAEPMGRVAGGAIVLASSGSINVSGVGGHGRGGPAYVASKAAIIGLTRALARSLAPSANSRQRGEPGLDRHGDDRLLR